MKYDVRLDARGISNFIGIEYTNKRSEYQIEIHLYSDIYNVEINKNGRDLLQYGKSFKYLFNAFRYIAKKTSIDLEVLNDIALDAINVSYERSIGCFKVLEMDPTISNIKKGDLLNTEIKEFVAVVREIPANINKIKVNINGKSRSFNKIKSFNVTEECITIEAEKDTFVGYPIGDKTLFLNIIELHNGSHECKTRHFDKIYGANNALKRLREEGWYTHETIHIDEIGNFINVTYYCELDD